MPDRTLRGDRAAGQCAGVAGQPGPVRSVTPQQVFEIAFEGLAPSGRHKSGVALRFPRISRWRTDLAPAAADRLTDVHALLPE